MRRDLSQLLALAGSLLQRANELGELLQGEEEEEVEIFVRDREEALRRQSELTVARVNELRELSERKLRQFSKKNKIPSEFVVHNLLPSRPAFLVETGV